MSFVRAAGNQDLARILGIAARRRAEYANYEPRFWRPADDAASRQRAHFVSLLSDPEAVFLVGCDSAGAVAAFVIARLIPPPPVYNPGGLTCFIDDFAVGDESDWPVMGADLIHAVKAWAAQRGGVQLVAVTGQRDLAKRDALDSAGLSLASEWWVGEMRHSVRPKSDLVFRPCSADRSTRTRPQLLPKLIDQYNKQHSATP